MTVCYSMADNPTNITIQTFSISHRQSDCMAGLVAVACLILACCFKIQSGQIEESNTGGHYNDTASAVECREKNIGVCREEYLSLQGRLSPEMKRPLSLLQLLQALRGTIIFISGHNNHHFRLCICPADVNHLLQAFDSSSGIIVMSSGVPLPSDQTVS